MRELYFVTFAGRTFILSAPAPEIPGQATEVIGF